MKAFDFEYDGKRLSDFGMIICHFGDKGLETINGTKITFNTVPSLGGSKYNLVSTQYEDCLECVIQICKHSCSTDIQEISSTEFRQLTKWLNRKKFLKFKILDEDYIDLYFEASFNINRIELDGKLYGLELEVITNRPFALKEPKTFIFEYADGSGNMKRFYTWEKYTAIEDILVETHLTEKIRIGYSSVSTTSIEVTYIDYADEMNVSNGEISLINPTRIYCQADTNIDDIKGKYIYSGCLKNYYKIPSTAQITSTTLYTTTSKYVSEAYRLTIKDFKDEFIENVSSENENSYPVDGVDDGYYYVYTGKRFACSINDISCEEGYIYPHTEITVAEDGDLIINNSIENRNTCIANCVSGEVITMDYPVIQSSVSSHKIQNDFNWNFFRVANTFENSRNDLIVSPSCIIKIKYSPIVKVGL